MEIERKWLVDIKMYQTMIKSIDSIETRVITQYYLNTIKDDWLIRVRSINNEIFILELKSKGFLSREEIGYFISEDEYIYTIARCVSSINKTRYTFIEQDTRFEVDIYNDHDFVTCEIEFISEEHAKEFTPPEWCTEEITYLHKYKNVALAKQLKKA